MARSTRTCIRGEWSEEGQRVDRNAMSIEKREAGCLTLQSRHGMLGREEVERPTAAAGDRIVICRQMEN